MARRALPAALAFTAFVGDLAGHHGLALAVLIVAIPLAFAVALDCYGDALDARAGIARPLLAGGALVLLVLSAALRSPAVVGGVPRLAVSAIGAVLLLYAAAAVGALLPVEGRAEAREAARTRRPAPEQRRFADAA
jgi:hypothetical protein